MMLMFPPMYVLWVHVGAASGMCDAAHTLNTLCSPQASVLDLKLALVDRVNHPVDRQKLIFRGHVLQDGHKLAEQGTL